MLDFIGPEYVHARQAEIAVEVQKRRWNHRLRELDARTPAPARRLPRRIGSAERRRALFARALEQAQREGITIDAWFGFRFADPELSARAEWAGLVDDASKTARDVWAA